MAFILTAWKLWKAHHFILCHFLKSVRLESFPCHLLILIFIAHFKLLLGVDIGWSTIDNPVISQIIRHKHNILNLVLIFLLKVDLFGEFFHLLTSPYKLLSSLLDFINLQRRYLHIALHLVLSFSLSLLESYRRNSKTHPRVFEDT